MFRGKIAKGFALGTGVLTLVLISVSVLGIVKTNMFWDPAHNSIRDLQELPLGRVRVQGVITYIDPGNKRFSLQDESGGMFLTGDASTTGLNVGQQVLLQADKTHVFDPIIGLESITLKPVKLSVLRANVMLPPSAPVTVNAFPDKNKNGIRITVEGVLHSVYPRDNGLATLYFGEDGQEIQAMVYIGAQQFTPWINTRICITGVAESVPDAGGSVRTRYIWVNDPHDVKKVKDGASALALYSVRSLYQFASNETGHRVLLHGRIAAQEGATRVLVEDKWGTISCDTDIPLSIVPGTPVEVAGFPVRYGLRIDLLHSEVRSLQSLEPESHKAPDTVALSTISSVRKLAEGQAKLALPVKLTGVVTFNDDDWEQLFLQDPTGGIFVKCAGHLGVARGEKVTIIGLTNPGDFAPIVVAPKLVAHASAKLPKTLPMTAQAWTGGMDALLVHTEGVVHRARPTQNPKHLNFDLYTSYGTVHVVAGPEFGDFNYLHKLEDSTVRIDGVSSIIFNSRKQLIGLQLVISRPIDIHVVEPGEEEPFQRPATPINRLLRFSPNARLGHRLTVSGVITMRGNGFFYVQDGTGGARVDADTNGLRVADLVDVAGFPSPEGYSPVLTDAIVRVKRRNEPVPIERVTPEIIGDGRFDSELVSIEGTLVSVVNSPEATTFVLRSNGRTLDAVLYLLNSVDLGPIPREGSLLRLTGICAVPVKDSSIYMLLTKANVTAKVIVRSPQDIQVLHSVSWWSAERAVVVAVALFFTVCASLAWIAVLRRRVHRQSNALRNAKEKSDAITDFIHVMQDVIRNKRFTSRVPVQGRNEIALLSDEFNHMLAELHLRDMAKTEAESRLQHQALTDELTGLPNRRLLSDRLSQVLEMAKRESRILVLLYLDLDGFKLVNDSLGHIVGDKLLAEVAQRLGSRIRKSDTLARLGGDEFTVVLTNLHCKDEATLVANNLLETLSRPFFIENQEITISASIGISVFPENGANATDLLQQADTAMYSAKRDGKNRIMYFTPELGSSARERLNLENELRGAIVRGEIAVHYQPEFDIATRRLVRFEALARWHHPTLGNIPPDRFIPVAEESGLIIPLGTFVLEQACREAVMWQTISGRPIQVAVNVSTVQFKRDSFVDEVAVALRDTGLAPRLLQLELTESVMLDGTERASKTMKRLAAMGISIAVDDFGTGYSCFSYLPRLPFNTLKIDRSFVNELGKRPEMTAMVRSLVVLAHDLNMQVVVEGVETVQQLEAIKAIGGNEVQGYLLGRPTAEPQDLLRTHSATLSPATADIGDSFTTKKSGGSDQAERRAQKAGG
jgi:diguanylate cyclase (GGDEF)-like protein